MITVLRRRRWWIHYIAILGMLGTSACTPRVEGGRATDRPYFSVAPEACKLVSNETVGDLVQPGVTPTGIADEYGSTCEWAKDVPPVGTAPPAPVPGELSTRELNVLITLVRPETGERIETQMRDTLARSRTEEAESTEAAPTFGPGAYWLVTLDPQNALGYVKLTFAIHNLVATIFYQGTENNLTVELTTLTEEQAKAGARRVAEQLTRQLG